MLAVGLIVLLLHLRLNCSENLCKSLSKFELLVGKTHIFQKIMEIVSYSINFEYELLLVSLANIKFNHDIICCIR